MSSISGRSETVNDLQVFSNSEFGQLQVLMIDGKEYFPASECASKLGYSNPHKAISDHCKNTITRRTNDSLGRQQDMNYIPEGDLYRLIARSNLPAAERFEKWVFDEVIPAIRKTGSYTAPMTIEDMIITQAQSVKELKSKVEEIDVRAEHASEQAELAHKRINELDNVNLIGDLRQRLVRKVQRYAERNGLTYSQGWKDFRQAFNTAFHTNLTTRRKYYMESRGIRTMTVPEYLEATNQLPDALRIAEKMMQPRQFTVV